MDYLSLISGTDNLRKFFVLLGISLFCFGFLFSLQKNSELKERKIKIEEQKKTDSTALHNTLEELEVSKELVNSVGKRLMSLTHIRDSLLKLKLDESEKFKLTFIQTEIASLRLKEDASMKNINDRIHTIESSSIHAEALCKEIENLESFIKTYKTFYWISMIAGFALFLFGIIKWGKNQKTSDEFKELELKIKKEELKKLENANRIT